MATCPNKDLQAWKDLTSQYGEVGAMFMYTIEGDIPTLSRAEEIALEYDLVGDNFLTSPNARVKPGVEELFDSNPELANQVYEALGFKSNSIENRLQIFFNQFGFQFKEGDSSTDLLRKIIYVSKTDNNVFIDNSVKALSQLLLANTNIDFNKLENLIEDTNEFKTLLSQSSEYIRNTHKYLKDGNRIPMEEWVSYIKQYNKIKNTVLEKYVKESLLDKNNSTALHKLIINFLEFFKKLFNSSKNLKDVTDSLVQQVLLNQREVVINSNDLKNKEKVTLAKALKETSHGKDIIKTFGEFGLILTGSISAAEQGTVFRKTGKLLHDIDWVVPKGFTKDFNKKLKDTFKGTTLVREFDSSTYYTQTYIVPPKGYTISNLTFFKPEIYGKNKYIASYDVLDKDGNIVSNYRRYYDVKPSGKVIENREVYNEGLENVDKNLEAVSVDFFQNKEDLKFEPYTVSVEGVDLQLSNWMSSFTEKLKYGRAKDLLDYANFIPNDVVPIDTEITPQQKQQAQQQYSQYLDTIFPESKVKDIVYHGTKGKKFDKFISSETGEFGRGVYFGNYQTALENTDKLDDFTLEPITGFDKNKIIPAVINTQNIYKRDLGGNGIRNEYVVEPEQIHILGSQKDIKGFKEFVADSSNEILLQTKKTEYKKDNATVKSKDVNDKLSEFAGKYGFSIQGLEDYKTSYKHRTGQDLNVDATALIDMFSKLIAIDPNTSDYSTLPEEIGHLADALLGDNPLAVNARNLAGESSVFEEIKDEYTEIYSKMFPHLNEAKIRELVKREALGKLIGKELIRDNSLTGKMKRVFEKLINLFLSKVSKAAELKKYVTEIADAVLDNNSNIFDQANINTREMFFQTKKSKFDRIVTTLENKLKILERKAYASDTKFEQAEKLKKEIEEIKASIANNLEIDAVDKFLDFALEETSTVLEAIEKGRQFSYAEIQDLDTFIRFYDPLLKEDVRPYVKRRNITELRAKVDKLSLDIEDLNTFYRDNRVESFKSVLGPLVDKIKNSKYAVNLDTYLNSVIDDITSTQAFMGISRLTKDQTVRQVAKIVTDSKNKVHFNTIEYAKRLGEVLEGLTREQLDLFYETTDGKASGYIAREQNYKKALDSLASFRNKINARYNISSESEQRAQQIKDMPDNVRKQYFKEIRQWWVKNSTVTKTSAEIESIYNQKKLTMSKKDFNDWVSTNIGVDYYGNMQASLSFNEFRVPKNSLYKNPAYEQIQKDPKLKKAYDTLLEVKGELDSKIPKKTNLYKLPQVSKTTLDRLINGRGFKEIPELVKQEFVSRVDDVEFGDQESIFNKDGVELKFIPIHYLKSLENTDDISRNIGGIFLNYAEMAENFVEMSSIAPQLELILDEVGDLKFKSGFKGKTKEGLESNVYKMLKGFMDEHLYGKEKEAITQEVFGVEVNITKVMNNVNRWVRNTNLINNWFTMATNLITSESWRKIEDIIGQHTTQESSFFALKEFINYLPSSVVDKYKVMKTNKLSLILERFKVMDDVKGQFANMDKSQAVKAAVSLPYLGYEMGDFKVKAHMTISMLDNIRFIDGEWQNRQTYLSKATTPEQKKQLQETWSNNRDKSLWNAYTVEGSKLKHSVPQELELEVITKIRTVGSRLDGMISETDRAAIHRHVYAQLFATHRNWLFQGVQDRFNPYVWDYSIGEMTGGRYRTAYNLASNLFKEAIEKKNIPDLIANWNNLEDFEKRNIYGVLLDQVYVATAFVFYLMMNALADDDKEDSYFIESMAYLSSRLLLEQSALVPVSILTGNIPMVSEMMAVMESPIPAARQLELLTDIYGWFDGTEVERGAYKGMSKRTKKLLKLIPGVKGAIESTDPKSKNQWLKNKALKSYWMQDYVTD